MKGTDNTHIFEDRTYKILIFMSEIILCLSSCLKSSNDRCFHSGFNSYQYLNFSTNVLEGGILQLGFAIKILKFTTPNKQTKTSK